MSNTHAHVPHWVHHQDAALVVETHDHRHGHCDLPDLTTWFQTVREFTWLKAWRTWNCQWEIPWWSVPPVCSCTHCFGNDATADRRHDRRTARQQLAAATRAVTPDAVADLLDDTALT